MIQNANEQRERVPEPESKICKYCGRELRYLPLLTEDDGTVTIWQPYPERCTCEQAAKYWADHDAKIEAERKADKERRRQARIEACLHMSKIPKRFMNRTFDKFEERTPELAKTLRTVRGYAEKFQEMRRKGIGLLLRGPNGTGKTHLAYAIALYLVDKEFPSVICQTSDAILKEFSSTFNRHGWKTEADVLYDYANAQLLIIDDLGKEHTSDWSTSTLFSIINARWEAQAPTVITTNYTDKGLEQNLSRSSDTETAKGIISRLHDRDWMISITVNGDDYRERKKK